MGVIGSAPVPDHESRVASHWTIDLGYHPGPELPGGFGHFGMHRTDGSCLGGFNL